MCNRLSFSPSEEYPCSKITEKLYYMAIRVIDDDKLGGFVPGLLLACVTAERSDAELEIKSLREKTAYLEKDVEQLEHGNRAASRKIQLLEEKEHGDNG